MGICSYIVFVWKSDLDIGMVAHSPSVSEFCPLVSGLCDILLKSLPILGASGWLVRDGIFFQRVSTHPDPLLLLKSRTDSFHNDTGRGLLLFKKSFYF